VEHDIAFGAADLAGKLFRDTFPDCENILWMWSGQDRLLGYNSG